MLAHKLKRQKTPRYKVVKSRSRYSCIVSGCSIYGIRYEIGKEVYALPDTMGIMCFKTRELALKWINGHYTLALNNIIIEVIPMGRGHIPQSIASPNNLKMYYEDRPRYIRSGKSWLDPPKGTICYPAVYVVN